LVKLHPAKWGDDEPCLSDVGSETPRFSTWETKTSINGLTNDTCDFVMRNMVDELIWDDDDHHDDHDVDDSTDYNKKRWWMTIMMMTLLIAISMMMKLLIIMMIIMTTISMIAEYWQWVDGQHD
jgi:hypothetical protein